MTEPPDAPPDDRPDLTPPPPPPPALDAAEEPITAGATLGAGCAGFALFFVAALVIGGLAAIPNGQGGIFVFVICVVTLIAAFVTAVRNAASRRRGLLVRGAIGFGVAAVVFGGCLAIVADLRAALLPELDTLPFEHFALWLERTRRYSFYL